MTMPRPIPASVRSLLPLCGAENGHEALGACRGITRKLRAAGLDWHDLAAAIPASDVNVDDIHIDKPTGPVPPFDVYAWRRAYTPRQEREHRARVRFCQNRTHRLTEWERGFVTNVAKLHGNLSIRQGDRLAVIVDRIEREGAK